MHCVHACRAELGDMYILVFRYLFASTCQVKISVKAKGCPSCPSLDTQSWILVCLNNY